MGEEYINQSNPNTDNSGFNIILYRSNKFLAEYLYDLGGIL